MPLQAYFNKLVLRGAANDTTPTVIEEDTGGDLLLTSGSGTTKLAGAVQYEDGAGFSDIKTKIDALDAAMPDSINSFVIASTVTQIATYVTNDKIPWNWIKSNSGFYCTPLESAWNTSTYVYTIPKSGYWVFACSVDIEVVDVSPMRLGLYYETGASYIGLGHVDSGVFGCTRQLDAGDQVSMRIMSGTTDLKLLLTSSYFSGQLLSQGLSNINYAGGSNVTIDSSNAIDLGPDIAITTSLAVDGTDIITEIGTKQDILTAGTNIDITNDVISSTIDMSDKQDALNSTLGVTVGSMVVGSGFASLSQGDLLATGDITCDGLDCALLNVSNSITHTTSDLAHNFAISFDSSGISQDPSTNILWPAYFMNSGVYDNLNILNMIAIHNDASVTNRFVDIKNLTIGSLFSSSVMSIAHKDRHNTTDYALIQTDGGYTIINGAPGQGIAFKIADITKVTIGSNGYMGWGSGNTSPQYPIHIASSVGAPYAGGPISYIEYTAGSVVGHLSNGGSGTSIWCSNAIFSGGPIMSASDRRIKTNIQDLNDASALDVIRLLKPKTYEYIDPVSRGSYTVIGFIAQDIRDDLPYAHKYTTEKIPNIFENGTISGNVLTFSSKSTSLLELNEDGTVVSALVLYDADNTEHNVDIVRIIDANSIEITTTLTGSVFVYGQTVTDFNTITKAHIFTTGIAALQEVDRQLQAERAKVAALESVLVSVLARLDALESA
jgi:hypothetical protein